MALDFAKSGVRCTRCEPFIYEKYKIFDHESRQWILKPKLCVKQCDSTETTRVEHAGLVFYWCAQHGAEPTHGAPKVAP